jgi:tetratricopeptide (TPR) repeat protein
MRTHVLTAEALGVFWVAIILLLLAQLLSAQPAQVSQGVILSVQGQVAEVLRAGASVWARADTNAPYNNLYAGDQVRTGMRTRVLVRWTDLTVTPIAENSHLQISARPRKRAGFNLLKGIIYFFHRDKPGEFDLQTPTVSAVVRGTEFNLQVADDGTTTLSLFDGAVEMTNQFGQLFLKSGEGGVAEPGRAPQRTAVLEMATVIQWALYYPGVLDWKELNLADEETKALAESLEAYRRGDLLAALAKYPEDRTPVSDNERIYRAALLLAVGQVDETEGLLKTLAPGRGREARELALAEAIRKVIASVKGQRIEQERAPALATEWLAESYYQQSKSKLEEARAAARKAVEVSPDFAFALARLAEMEFSFGRIDAAGEAVEKSLQLAPRNAQALALKGFLLSAQNRISAAVDYFDQAIAIDGALGNAWLGRGLCRIRQGHAEEGRKDIQVAATVEPQRAVLRSYLGKAFSHAGDNVQALKELEFARRLDTNDPTAWLYSSLIKQQENQINEAVRDLETSQALNENRRVYRSRLLLDQDRSVRGVNLATIYEDAGMTDVSLREAVRSVNADYANYSAHLFLAGSYNALRDPRLVNLRYETPALNEYLVANLLADARAGTLSPYITQQEYSKLFERDHFGFSSSTEYLSRGDWTQNAAHYGIMGNTSYAAEVSYLSFNGQGPNNDLEQVTTSLKVKHHLTPQDSVYVQGIYSDAEYGDLRQHYDPNDANPDLRIKETQEPILLLGYHREWAPGSHTLLLAGRLQDTLRVSTTNQPVLLLFRDTAPPQPVIALPYPGFPVTSLDYRSEFEAYTVELQQIWQSGSRSFREGGGHSVIVGARYQTGTFDSRGVLGSFVFTGVSDATRTNVFGPFQGEANSPPFETDLQRINFYGYHNWQVVEPLLLTAGVSYDILHYPLNHRESPLTDEERTTYQLSPKGGFIWTPLRNTTIRGAYTRSLAGVSFDQSFQLEPSQVAGFNQAYRSLIPESVAGSMPAAEFETWGLALDQKFGYGTYIGVQGEILSSEVDRSAGAIDALFNFGFLFAPSKVREHLDYEERNLLITLNQLVGKSWVFGARYRVSEAELERDVTDIPLSVTPAAHSDREALLHQVNLYALFNHASGFFSSVESLWSKQSNRGDPPVLANDDFWQFNAFIGYRFPRRYVEVRAGVLNITDQDYRLNPLNLTSDLPRKRTVLVGLKFHF